jgi:glycosyltransferase involved in cell wall biosynthesis
MVGNKPHVTIGLPVFNGENYLSHAIESILAQTYEDFELIISDNASTDGTQQICREYAKRDSRISYHESKRNFGATWNFNRVFKLSSSEYFKWAAHDDVLAPEFLQKCLNILDNDPDVVLCHSKTGLIDERGTLVGNYDDMTLDKISSVKPQERFADMMSGRNSCWSIFGVMRAGALIKTPLHGDYIGADRNLLAEIGLMGKMYEIPEYLFFRRGHVKAYTNRYYSKASVVRNYKAESGWWMGNKPKPLTNFPNWRICLEFFKSVNRVPLKWSEKCSCYDRIGKWIMKEGWRLMKWDLINAFKLWRIRLNGKNSERTRDKLF